MRLDEIDSELRAAAFEFFYWFLRFEFALKERKYLKDTAPGANAEPSWERFKTKHQVGYVASAEAAELVRVHPKRQVVASNGQLDWTPVGVAHCKEDLCKVVTMLCTIRNNLFHGGKAGDRELDDKERNLQLLLLGKVVLDQLSQLANFGGDYDRYY